MAYGKITVKQSEILEYIKKEILNKGYPPSVPIMMVVKSAKQSN